MGYVAERVAPYKKLRGIEVIDQIPKSPSGKILRRVLIEREKARSDPALSGAPLADSRESPDQRVTVP